nr:hypothetical protein [uncultured Allomuricauda sp.]
MLQEKKTLGLLFFIGLMLLKVSAFHVYTHDHYDDCDSIENCEICDIVLDNQTSNVDIPQPIPIDIFQLIISQETADFTSPVFFYDSKFNHLFCRPPPLI